MSSNPNSNFPFHRSQSADLTHPQPRTFFQTNSNNVLPSISAPASFQRRTVEGARQLRDSLTSVIREIEPLVETARSVNAGVTNFLNRPQSEVNVSRPPVETNNDSYYINLEIEPSRDPEAPPVQDNENFNNTVNNTDNNNTEDSERAQNVVEAQQFIKVLLKYVPFVLILLAKTLYDYHEGIFILVILFITFAHTNSAVKRETVLRQRRSVGVLAMSLLYIAVCLIFIHYVFADDLHDFNVVLNLVLIRSFTHTLTVWNLLWIVTITDFTLKLMTVSIKILLTMLPGVIIDFKKRGKIYLFIEAISQMYRSIATIQPWLYYLLESYQGPEKIVAVFLSAFYMISKGSDLMSRVKLLKVACLKLLQNVSIGSSPSKDQIQTAGDHCPICHDQYDSPVLLQCRHIFCESCVTTWFDREQTCPLCRAKIVDDPSWRDGSTSYFMQLF
ncbi:RING finger and transmembrane domain-containing protein 2 [Diabrotica virgifera virgifera]|uniref:RING finger and transmembrane domain-containing protein 2 n=1 Tax=Diabrotica virgifera virgifera TaxID=50390 RepID=A0A6P7FH96_DIAVI|nr:RING finger and transmembrane domain-containing protein 2 [Diabrotica virgifera virgifera]